MSYLMSPEDISRVVEQAVEADRRQRTGTYARMESFTRIHGITRNEWRTLVAVAEHPDQSSAARALGVSLQTVKNNLTTAKHRLQASTVLDAYMRLGWLVIPNSEERPEGQVENAMAMHGHHFAHLASCPCMEKP